MKRKQPKPEVVPEVIPPEVVPEVVAPVTQIIAKEIRESAKRSIALDRAKAAAKCSVCSGDSAVSGEEQLCWICRRLKISAWRDVEAQIPMQE